MIFVKMCKTRYFIKFCETLLPNCQKKEKYFANISSKYRQNSSSILYAQFPPRRNFHTYIPNQNQTHILRSGTDVVKKIYSQLRNSLFRSLDSQIGVRFKNREPLVTPNAGLSLNYYLKYSIFKISKLFRIQESRLLN